MAKQNKQFDAYEASFHLGRAYGWGKLTKPQRLVVMLQAFAVIWPKKVPINIEIGKEWI